MSLCEVHDCPSNENAKIDGREVYFFPFPEDDARRNQWLQNCKLTLTTANDKQPCLCELHFENPNFLKPGELKPDAVPTIFTTAEETQESQKKHKVDTTMQIDPESVTPAKQRKLDENSQDSMVTPPQSPVPRLSHNIKEETFKVTEENKEDISQSNTPEVNGIATKTSEEVNQSSTGKRIYRLTIQIDKIRAKPGPKSKKFMSLIDGSKLSQVPVPLSEVEPNNRSFHKTNKVICAKGGCKLKKSAYESKPAFQCELCDKFYVMKKDDNVEENTHPCSMCSKTFSSQQSLYLHTKKHFVCDMCQTECNSQLSFDKHTRLHVSTDPLFPYKCHQCTETFELKEDVKQHYLIAHPTVQLQNTILKMTSGSTVQVPQKEHRCITCNITFRNEQAYRNHVNSHKQKEGLRCNISETNNIIPVPNPLTGSQIGILRAVKFSCRVCSKEFDNVGEVDKHTRTHLEDVEEKQKCNICKKHFKSSTLLNEHLKHHLSRAHPCPICPKAFINRTTLKIHLKRHSDA